VTPRYVALAAAIVSISCAAREPPPAKRAPEATTEAKKTSEGEGAGRDRAPAADATSSTTTLPSTLEPLPTPAPTTAPAARPSESVDRRARAVRAARRELDQAQRDLDASMWECGTACRALGSMERATGHLCDLATDAEDRRRCEDAKTAVLKAREKIRAACGSCPNGPSLEKTAPIPSRP
jgi:hypothetical protein